MKSHTKYKIYNNLGSFLKNTPLRILKFKRPKWLKLQTFLKKINIKKWDSNKKKWFKKKRWFNNKKKSFFYNNCLRNANKKYWLKKKFTYREGLYLNRRINIFFDFSISNKNLRKKIILSKKTTVANSFNSLFSHFLFRLDIFLKKIGLFKSSYQAAQSINNNEILVNGEIVINTYILSYGDIVGFKNLNNKKINIIEFNFFYSFIEIDYYTNTFIIIKSPLLLNETDYVLFLKNYIKIKTLFDYLKK